MDPRALAQHIADSLDGEMGPEDEGFLSAHWDATDEYVHVVVEYTDDEFGVKSKFLLTLEEV